jgi:hypothetical protein
MYLDLRHFSKLRAATVIEIPISGDIVANQVDAEQGIARRRSIFELGAPKNQRSFQRSLIHLWYLQSFLNNPIYLSVTTSGTYHPILYLPKLTSPSSPHRHRLPPASINSKPHMQPTKKQRYPPKSLNTNCAVNDNNHKTKVDDRYNVRKYSFPI